MKKAIFLKIFCISVLFTLTKPANSSNCIYPFLNSSDIKIQQPKELGRRSNKIQRWFGKKFIKINPQSVSDLAEDMWLNKSKYGLVFKGDKGLFTDLGIFDFLENSWGVLKIPAGSDKTFYIILLPSGNFVLYLKNRTKHGEELGFVKGSAMTSAIIHWFDSQSSHYSHSIGALKKSSARLLRPEPFSSGEANKLLDYTNEGVLPAVERLIEINNLLLDKDLEQAARLAAYQNRLQYMDTKGVSAHTIVSTFQEMEDLFFSYKRAQIESLVFFTLLSHIKPQTAKKLFDELEHISYDTSERLALFIGIAFDIKMRFLKGSLPESEISFETAKEILKEHKKIYETAKSINRSEDYLPYLYLSSVISGKNSELAIIEDNRNFEYIYENAKKGSGIEQLLLLRSSLRNVTAEQIVSEFNELYKVSGGKGEVALSLMGVELDSRFDFYQRISEQLYKGASFKKPDAVAKLFISGLKANLSPEQVLSILSEISFYTKGQIDSYELFELAHSIIYLNRFNQIESESTIGKEELAEQTSQIINKEMALILESINNMLLLTTATNLNVVTATTTVTVSATSAM